MRRWVLIRSRARRARSQKATGTSPNIHAPAVLLPFPTEQPPLRLALMAGCGTGVGVNIGMSVGVLAGGRLQMPERHCKPASQSELVVHGSFGFSRSWHVPLNPVMSQRCGAVQLTESQHTESKQLPLAHCEPLEQSLPFSRWVGVGVGVAGSRAHWPSWPGTRHEYPGGQALSVPQQTDSAVLQKRPAWHCEVLVQKSPPFKGVGVAVKVGVGCIWQVPLFWHLVVHCPSGPKQ